MRLAIIIILVIITFGFVFYTYKEKIFVSKKNTGAEWPPEIIEKADKDRESRKAIIEEYSEVFSVISALMFKHDPIGIKFETNTDEYDAEAGTVIPRLKNANSEYEAISIVHEEFVIWFGADTAGQRKNYIELGREIWVVWNEKT
jgi:hypothetical protein